MTPEALAHVHAQGFTVPRPWSAKEFCDLLSSAGVFVIGDAQGFALGRIIADEVELLTITVLPTLRGQGKGRALLADFETTAQDMGARDCFLEVAANNTAARALYASAGYTEAGLRKAYYHAPQGVKIDAVVMRKHLP